MLLDDCVSDRQEDLLGRCVNVTVTIDKQISRLLNGWIAEFDPVTRSIFIISNCGQLTFVNGNAIHAIEFVAESHLDTSKLKIALRNHLGGDSGESLPAEDLEKRKQQVRAWIQRNRLTIECKGDDLSIYRDTVIIKPPYNENSCIGTNEVVLSKIRKIVQDMPKDFSA